MSSSDYITNYDNNHTHETCEEASHQPPARQPRRHSIACWIDSHESKEYNLCYCALCDKQFKSLRSRERHVARSSRHPYCEICDRRFLNGNALRAHIMYSYEHYYNSRDGYDSDDEHPPQNDMSWEIYDDFDFDDVDCVGDEVPECIAHLVKREDKEEGEEEEQNEAGPPATEFTCPVCEHTPKTVCSTMCGHIFCAPCIKMAFEISGSCPVCDEEGNVKQLRKTYISA
ncbi:hypothetical protein C0995_009659 [Termitomyces sp. Mi166|nr:hypothetical protein C0995_009659 [Termitomyces sp. Mi166\